MQFLLEWARHLEELYVFSLRKNPHRRYRKASFFLATKIQIRTLGVFYTRKQLAVRKIASFL
jgi:hypothetical protein